MNLNEINVNDLNNLDLQAIGTAPVIVRALFLLIFFAIVLVAGYFAIIQGQMSTLEKEEKKETQLRSTFEDKQKKSANLDAYKSQLEDMRRSFGTMLKQLPSKTEIEGLIVDISQTALASGLETEYFRPKSEESQGFYTEQPYELRVHGKYHELANFASGVAALPRIVTLHNISIEPAKTDNATLTMNAIVKTYRYQDGG